MRAVVLASVAVSVELCASAPAVPTEVDTILADAGAAEVIAADEPVSAAFRQTVSDVFARPHAYRWVWTAPPDDNPVLALLELLEGRGVPTRVARVMAYAAAVPRAAADAPGCAAAGAFAGPPVELAGVTRLGDTTAATVMALPERDLWRVPVDQAGVVLGRASAIPCLAALQTPQPDYPLGGLPPVLACKALETWAKR